VELGPAGFLPADPVHAAQALAGHGLRLAAGFVPAVLHRPEHRAEAAAWIRSAAGTLAAAGGEVLVLAAELGNGGYDRSFELSDTEWGALVEGIALAETIASDAGVRLAFHPHYGTAIERAPQVERLLASCDVPLCVDTGHLLVGGADPVSIVRAAAGRIGHVHLKDADAALATEVRTGRLGYRDAVRRGMYRPLGDGGLDLAGVLTALTASGYSGWYVLEQDVVLESEPADGAGPVSDAARSLAFLRGVMKQ
jgi:inosose dehydratase